MTTLTRDDLRAIALLESLDDDQLEQLLVRQRESAHLIDQVIVMEQDWGESLLLLRDGLAKVRSFGARTIKGLQTTEVFGIASPTSSQESLWLSMVTLALLQTTERNLAMLLG